MAVVRSLSTALPKFHYSKEEFSGVGDSWLRESPREKSIFNRFVSSSQINNRYFAVPLDKILTLGGQEERAQCYQSEGSKLLSEAIKGVLHQNKGLEAKDIDYLITTSCSSPIIPAVDVGIVAQLKLRDSISRIPIYQHGCAGGIIGLALGHRLLKPNEKAVVSAVELCSLVYQAHDLASGNLVGSAIFGDGAAAVLLDGSDADGLAIVDARSNLIPNSAQLLGYNSMDDGAHIRLDRELPGVILESAPSFLSDFLAFNGLGIKDIDWWLFHPGGVKILQAFEEAFGVSKERSYWAWNVLEKYGNMSSAAIFFVFEEFMASNVLKTGNRICVVGVGPGLTIEALILEKR